MARKSKPSGVPETMLPTQFPPRSTLANTPERRLVLAVLMSAVVQLQQGDVQGVSDTERWIRNEAGDVPLPFVDACDALGMEPHGLAAALMTLPVRPPHVPPARQRGTAFGTPAPKKRP